MSEKKIQGPALTYDEVLLLPDYSEILPREADTRSFFSKNIPLNIPLVSAAMDTVTEYEMAISIAREGGIGVIHKNMSIEEQAQQIRRVKRAESGMITDPLTLNPEATIEEACLMMQEQKIGGIPIIEKNRKLVGIITNRDLRFEKELLKKVKEVMTPMPLITAQKNTDLKKAEVILQKHKIEKLPVVDKSNTLVGLITFRDILKVKEHPMANKDDFGRLRVAAAIGVTDDSLLRAEALIKAGCDALVVDTAHAHSLGVLEIIKKIKNKFKNQVDLVAGNIATEEAAKALVIAGVDGVKVGIGPGSICTTRVVTGVGIPQLSAIMQVAKGLKSSGIPLIADGGIKYTGDIPKAIAAGADCVMLGSLLAGTKESPSETIIYEGRRFKAYRGMGSIEAMEKGSGDRYFQEGENSKKMVPEGIVGRVPYRGLVKEVVYQFVGGLRAAMGYTGAKDIPTLKKKKLIQIMGAGIVESHPHSVTIVKESPNYSR